MSGGYFDYVQYRINDICDSLEKIIKDNPYDYDEKTLDKFRQAFITTEQAYLMIHRIDWLLSCDDSEESFHEQWEQEIS
jgi:hypothetical protein